MRWALAALWTIGLALGQADDPLAAVRAEANPEKRYSLALEFGDKQIKRAREQYDNGRLEGFRTALQLVDKSVRLCDDSLRSTGKDPARSPKHFKRAEKKLREMLRKLSGLENAVSVNDRSDVEKVRMAVQELQEEMLIDIVGRRK